ncbi:related to N-acetyltransferase [Ustilago trichophora]|uniref:Related to N-acetyltransferase n=1 Tax=Ustilago trichophora TaxID=86804 RepID=A0A5C3DQL4_9BASI|nr:related to N-acetyltransferase [Ustilago trichophora]
MRINRNTVLVGHKVILVPYRKQHVPRYHEWMKDPLIQEQTASEPLSLDEEYEMQQSWAVDEDKLTFIILARPDGDDAGPADATSVPDLISRCKMVGDVNIFFNEVHDDDDNDEDDTEQAAPATKEQEQRSVFDAECEIMIAERSYRRKGIAREALQMMFSFVTTTPTPASTAPSAASETKEIESQTRPDPTLHCTLPIPPKWLTCKISLTNNPSIQLFESLGFTRQKVSEVWQEVEMRFTDTNSHGLGQSSESIREVLFWPDE